jgi:putative ABC transport system permease protein
LVLAVVLGLLAAATVAQSLVVSVRRRRREFATLRALGFTSSQVRSAVSWQATTVAVTGVIIGMPLGLLAGREAWRAVANQLGVPEHASVPRLLLLLVLPVAVLAINIVGIFAAHRAGRCTPAEALRDE